MSYGIHPQCAFCVEMTRYLDYSILPRERPLYHFNTYTHFPERPLLYCYDMTQRPPQDTNYITYCNMLNPLPGDQEPQYVQVIDPGVAHARMQFCVPSNRLVEGPSQSITPNKIVLDRPDPNCGVVLCTCNDFINNSMQNRILYESIPRRQVPPQFTRDSMDSIGRSIEDQPDTSIYSNGSVLSDPMCRFCHLSKNTQSDQLISPCYCCGTLKYVHQNCLKTWLEVSKKQRENNGNKPPHCELCNFKYVRKRKFQFGKIRQPKLSQNDCALHLIFLCSLLVMVTSASVTILCFAMEKSAVGGGRMQFYDKPSESSGGSLKFGDRKSADMSKSSNILCEYLSNLNLKEYSNSQRQSASKLSVICDLMLNKDRRPDKVSDLSSGADSFSEPLLKITTLATLWKKDLVASKGRPGGSSGGRGAMWILSPEEAVTLASGVIFFIAFFIAMVVQVKSSYTCYQLVMQWVRLNYTHEVQSLHQQKKKESAEVEMKPISDQGHAKVDPGLPREYIERCVTEI